MPVHKVYFRLPKRELGNIDAHFYIYQDDFMHGQITISKGGMDYLPANSKKVIKMSWSQLDKMIREWKKN